MVNRREILTLAATMPFAAQLSTADDMDPSYLTILQAATALRLGDISAEYYATALILKSKLSARLNAFISTDHEALLQAANEADRKRRSGAAMGLLHGVPLAFKDNIATTEMVTTAGTGALRSFRPERNAVVAQSLFDAGALLFGKNNMHELAAGITSNNAIYGAVRNPYNTAMISGGSSGGTAAAIAARIVPGGLGTDTGGSVRIPASLCGVCGLRPTTGRYPGVGIVPFASGTAVAGPMARSVHDLVLLDSIITSDVSELPGVRADQLRIGIPEDYFYAELDSEVARVMDTVLDSMRQAGVTLVKQPIAGLDDVLKLGSGGPAADETTNGYAEFFAGSEITAEEFIAGVADPGIRVRLARQLLAEPVTTEIAAPSASDVRARYKDVMQRYFRDYRLDAMVIPPTPLPARPVGQELTVELNGQQVSTFRSYVRNTMIGSAASLPGVVIPAGMTRDGLPLGVELDGPPGTDRRLLAIAAVIENLLPVIRAPDNL